MVIEILFSEIADKAKIYNETLEKNRSRFTGEMEESLDSQYIGKEYCTQRMEIVKSKIPNIKKCDYKGALKRIANEVFELKTEKTTYTVSCTIDTYQSKKTRMLVRISSEIQDGQNVSVSTDFYDQVLEKLKLEVKNVFRSDWKKRTLLNGF